MLSLFTKHINVHDEFFLPANLSDQMEKAEWLDALPLSLADRYTFSLCPISTKIPMLENALHDWAEQRARGKAAPLLRMMGTGGRNELQYLEDSCKLYAAYAWLGYRMPETFPDGEMAQMLMLSTSERIDGLLQVQNAQKRKGRRGSEPARRGGGGGRRR
ncbi:Mitochondrial degradasome RNA helicase subunit C terminal [Chromobacterium violaceum]|uniref:Mitochondrial degradasome RNA helicase subunit C terminal n=1 Tax=Chromobacterium violaceum TaxID=536 RepID=A0A447TCE4_CHRVL|nr:Mitochondrial degradasome RNA helicase subunit C terminal [Chromobacterium violaceum]